MRKLIVGIVVAAAIAVVGVVVAVGVGGIGGSSSSSADAAGFTERYQAYSEQAVADAAPDETVVLFFSASWCPTCKVLRDDLAANAQNIPDDVLILLVDYDSSTELKQQHGVTSQHTLVQVDNSGQGLLRWQHSRSLDELLAAVAA